MTDYAYQLCSHTRNKQQVATMSQQLSDLATKFEYETYVYVYYNNSTYIQTVPNSIKVKLVTNCAIK